MARSYQDRSREQSANLTVVQPPRLPMPAEAVDVGLTPSQWRVLIDVVYPAATNVNSIMLALHYCRARKLDPMKRPVHIVPMWSKSRGTVDTLWPGINELKVTAARTNAWAGMDPPKWGPEISMKFYGASQDRDGNPIKAEERLHSFPEWCEVTVHRIVGGQRYAFSEPVYWLETYATESRWSGIPNEMWLKRPRGQLHKCALAASLRAAFPEEVGYAAEEMEGKPVDIGAGKGPVIDHEPDVAPGPGPVSGEPGQSVVAESAGPRQEKSYTIVDAGGQIFNKTTDPVDAADDYLDIFHQTGTQEDRRTLILNNLDLLGEIVQLQKDMKKRDLLARHLEAGRGYVEKTKVEPAPAQDSPEITDPEFDDSGDPGASQD